MPTHNGMPCGSAQPKTVCCVTSENSARIQRDEQHRADERGDGQEDAADGARRVAHVGAACAVAMRSCSFMWRELAVPVPLLAAPFAPPAVRLSRTPQSFFLRG